MSKHHMVQRWVLFYLKSRGIALEQAKGMLVEGFCREVLDHFFLSSLLEKALYQLSKITGSTCSP